MAHRLAAVEDHVYQSDHLLAVTELLPDDLVNRYLEHEITTMELDRSLGRCFRAVAKMDRDDMRRYTYGKARNLLAELGYGHRTERSVRVALRRFMRAGWAKSQATGNSQTVYLR